MRPHDDEAVVELGATCIHGASPENPVYRLATEWGMADSLVPVDRCGCVLFVFHVRKRVVCNSTCVRLCDLFVYLKLVFVCVMYACGVRV